MKLLAPDRITLLTTLPRQGDFLTLSIAQEIRDRIDFTKEERAAIDLKIAEGNVSWNPERDSAIDVDFDQPEIDMIAAALIKLNEKKSLGANQVGIYRLFVLGAGDKSDNGAATGNGAAMTSPQDARH